MSAEKFSRRGFITGSLAGLGAMAVAREMLWAQEAKAPGSSSTTTPPNIILILADDLGYGELGSYGCRDTETPNLDKLAAEGIRFTDFYSNSPLCSPTRSALLSGMYPQHAGVWKGVPKDKGREDLKLKDDVVLLPQILKKQGYATALCGKWHLGGDAKDVPNERGFDYFFGFLGGSMKYGPTHHKSLYLNREPHEEEGNTTDLFTNKACEFIRANRSKPFFLYLAFNATHGPIDSGAAMVPQLVKKYVDRGVDPKRADFCAVVECMDSNIGRLMATLKELGLDEKTAVYFSSDNGGMEEKWSGNNGSFRAGKGQVYEGGIRVPGIIRWKGKVPAGAVSDCPVVSMDYFSTIVDSVNVEPPPRVSGISMRELIESGGKKRPPERMIFFELKGKVAVRQGKWKLAGDMEPDNGSDHPEMLAPEFELYDLAADSGETKDLAKQNPQKQEELKNALTQWLKTFKAHRGLK